jgi:hypothetical protein
MGPLVPCALVSCVTDIVAALASDIGVKFSAYDNKMSNASTKWWMDVPS